MSQKLDDLKRDFESKLHEFYNNEVKEHIIKLILSEQKLLETYESTLKQIANEMRGESSDYYSLQNYVDSVKYSILLEDKDTQNAIMQLASLEKNFYDGIENSIKSEGHIELQRGSEVHDFDENGLAFSDYPAFILEC